MYTTPVLLDTTPHVITSLLAMGMALSFIIADRSSPTSRALSLFLASVGLAIGIGSQIAHPLHVQGRIEAWDGLFAIPETFAFIFAYEWVLRVRRTVPARDLKTHGPDRLLRVAQLLAAFYGVASIGFPELRVNHFINAGFSEVFVRSEPEFWLFALPLTLSLVLGLFPALLMLRRRPDRAEALRLLAFALAAPFMASGVVLPPTIAPVATAIGLLIFLVGAVQYHVVQGRRAQFMSRFLAPQVAELVRVRGLKSATDEKTLELSVVCCDLRGFTAFTASTSSKKVMAILREYYDAVGAAAAAFGGTIKDQAGDGVLVLVGAPVAFEDHAKRALEMAKRIRETGVTITSRWSDADLRLGVGVGVASGYVTVGVIGAASRLEYTAVGPAVNLAARLCSEAAHGQVLVDARTTAILDGAAARRELQPGEALQLKGFQQPVQSYILSPV
ncbi:MAG TPA: adenylate/guanylate cyclase domain-containing protein [Burkholderiales bacterium]|jgi:adenylate cyclase|nr:adenylate/guanylate cyclase domain-containing protein [Burkholderiales bacterium]